MTCGHISLVFLCVLRISTSDWVADWMTPVQERFEEQPSRKNTVASLKQYEDEYKKMAPVYQDFPEKEVSYFGQKNEHSTSGLKLKLESALDNAKMLAETIRVQIQELSSQEARLKEAITRGRSGISTVTVSTVDQRPRSYLIREGIWTLCTGIIQSPAVVASYQLNGLFSTPRCIGQEVPTRQDPCVFNSIIKYETIPSQRRLLYIEDDYLCLKSSFNSTVEQYLSVPRRLINDTCADGIIRSLEDNTQQCGIRVLSEYSYYPHRGVSSPRSLPLEYCTEEDGSCRLIVAWHVSNASVENFEFLKNEQEFKNFFINDRFSNSMVGM